MGPLPSFFLASLLLAGPALSEQEKLLLPCRPTIACTAELAPIGVMQIELGYLRRDLGQGVIQHSVPFLLKLTVFDWLEAQLGSNGPTFSGGPRPARFHDNLQPGLKARFFEGGGALPTLDASIQLSIPTPGRQLGYLKATDLLFTLYFTYVLSLDVEADLNVGTNVFRIEGDAQLQPWAALALSRDLPLSLTAMVETYRFGDVAALAPRDAGLLFALSWSPFKWVAFDVGGDAGLLPQGRRFSVFSGASFSTPRLWSKR